MERQAGAAFFEEAFARVPVLAILRGLPPEDAVTEADRCWDAGIPLVEVSLSGAHAREALAGVCARGRERGAAAGAGTVLDPGAVRTAVELGASFAVAPSFAPDTVLAADAHGLPYLPGVATPTEVQRALGLGCRTLKLFPAAALGLDWLRAFAGPFPEARFVAVGGIDATNASAWVDAGAAVGIGSGLPESSLEEFVEGLARS